MQKLIDGHRSFLSTHKSGPPWSPAELAAGQAPKVVVLTCSDSRVVLETALDLDPGDLFVLRNAGNFLPAPGIGSSEEASIEYAVKVLKVETLVVCGHTYCGAIGAIYNPPDTGPDGVPAVGAWIKNGLEVKQRAPEAGPKSIAGVGENTRLQLERAMSYPAVRSAVEAGTLQLQAWIYDVETGEVSAFNSKLDRFAPLHEPISGAA